jgi:hypothetical protein
MVDCRVVGASLQQQNIEIYVVCETEQLQELRAQMRNSRISSLQNRTLLLANLCRRRTKKNIDPLIKILSTGLSYILPWIIEVCNQLVLYVRGSIHFDAFNTHLILYDTLSRIAIQASAQLCIYPPNRCIQTLSFTRNAPPPTNFTTDHLI